MFVALGYERTIFADRISELSHNICITAHLCCKPGHASTTETVENKVAGLCIVEDVVHDRLIRYLRVVRVGAVHRISLSLAHIHRKWFPAIMIGSRVIRLPIVLNEILDKRVRTSGVIRRIGQYQDVLVLTNGESLDLPKLRVLELLAQLFQKIFSPCLVGVKR